MSKGYWIALYTNIYNLENLTNYAVRATKIIQSYGGVPLVRGGKYKFFSGDEFKRTVIWEFPSFDDAIKCHNCLEYQKAWSIAKNTTKRHLQIVEGFSTE
jgi:uncharacterized protein (DUF1330 family)